MNNKTIIILIVIAVLIYIRRKQKSPSTQETPTDLDSPIKRKFDIETASSNHHAAPTQPKQAPQSTVEIIQDHQPAPEITKEKSNRLKVFLRKQHPSHKQHARVKLTPAEKSPAAPSAQNHSDHHILQDNPVIQ